MIVLLDDDDSTSPHVPSNVCVWLFSSNSQREISALTSQQSSELASGKAQLKFVCICKQLDRLTLCVLIALLVYCFF